MTVEYGNVIYFNLNLQSGTVFSNADMSLQAPGVYQQFHSILGFIFTPTDVLFHHSMPASRLTFEAF